MKKEINYKFEHKYNRFEINVNEKRALPILVLSEPIFESSGKLVEKGIIYLGDYIADDFIAMHPTARDNWFIVSTTQSHVIPNSVNVDLHLYTTNDGKSSKEYQQGPAKHIPDLILGCGHYVDDQVFCPNEATQKIYDLIYVSKWAPTKRIEHVVELARLNPQLSIAILGFPVVSERKRSASDAYRANIIGMIENSNISNIQIIEHSEEKHNNSDGTEVVGGFTKQEICYFLNQAMCSILTADQNEAINRSLVEAICCNLPVMLTKDTMGGAQTLINAKTGISVNPDPQSILEGLNYILANRNKFSPREWYLSLYGITNANLILKNKIAEVGQQRGIAVNTERMKLYRGDLWGYDYYAQFS